MQCALVLVKTINLKITDTAYCVRKLYITIELVVGISATMCHSAEKIPAKEGCQSKRVSKKHQSYPPEYLNRPL